MITYAATFLGSGTYSGVVRVVAGNGSQSWAFAVAVSHARASPLHTSSTIKTHHEIISELACARMTASLRQPGFLPHYRAFVVDGRSFVAGARQSGSFLAALFGALTSAANRRADRWRDFQGHESNVLISCMGLGDGGDVANDKMLARARMDPPATRQWIFVLAWSLLVAQRTFAFEHRDIKLGNLVLSDEGTGRSTFQLNLAPHQLARQGVGIVNAQVHFAVARTAGTLSALVPKFIDLNFSSYALTSVDEDEEDFAVIRNAVLAPGVTGGKVLPPLYPDVNHANRELATYPSPDMIFDIECEARDFDSDVFSFGIAALELLAAQGGAWFSLVSSDADVAKFRRLCTTALDGYLNHPDANATRNILTQYGRELFAYMQLLHVLHDELLPPPSSRFRQSLLFRLLERPSIRTFVLFSAELSSLQRDLQSIEQGHGSEALAFLRACLTWDKERRGAFPGSPLMHAETPATFRLLFHSYFAPLRTTAEGNAISGHYVLNYQDPPSIKRESGKRMLRVTQRILAIETGVIRQIEDNVSGGQLELEMGAFVGQVMRGESGLDTDEEGSVAKRPRIEPEPATVVATSDTFQQKRPPLLSLWADEETL
jgi:serine/threonine protein kinase